MCWWVRFTFRPLRWWFATPMFHHWHHAADRDAIDKNFAIHLPLLDWLFGTFFLPPRWPKSYGLAGGIPVPDGYLKQTVAPFLPEKSTAKPSEGHAQGSVTGSARPA